MNIQNETKYNQSCQNETRNNQICDSDQTIDSPPPFRISKSKTKLVPKPLLDNKQNIFEDRANLIKKVELFNNRTKKEPLPKCGSQKFTSPLRSINEDFPHSDNLERINEIRSKKFSDLIKSPSKDL